MRGYKGLVFNEIVSFKSQSVSNIIQLGGTILKTARSQEFTTTEGRKAAYDNMVAAGIDALVVIGGDGSFMGARALAIQGIPCVGIPGTIDNDIACSSYSIGYDTACNTALESIDKLRDTMQSHERCSVVEVMGHRAGHLALTVGVACGATAVIVQEHPVDYEADLLEPIRRARLAGRTHFMIIVAEGVEGGAYSIGKVIEEATALDTRVSVLGHSQRGGAPSSRDRITATYMGYEAVRLLAEGKTCRVVALQGENYVDYDITEALQMTKSLDQHTYEAMRALTGVH